MTDGTVETQAGRWLMAGLTQVAHWDEDAATNAVSDVESEARAAALREVAELAQSKHDEACLCPDDNTDPDCNSPCSGAIVELLSILTEATGAQE